MKTESSKSRCRRISHADPFGEATDYGFGTEQYSTPDDAPTTNSGKFSNSDWVSIINNGSQVIGDVIGSIFGKTPTYINNTTNTTETEKDNTALYVGIGAGALVLILLLVVILKK